METMKILVVGLLFSTLLLLGHSTVSYAEEHSQADIQTLKDSAAALKADHPDLSDKLTNYADRESGEARGKEEGEEDEQGNIKLLKDSAAALQASNPQLADGLRNYADREAREEKQEESKVVNLQ